MNEKIRYVYILKSGRTTKSYTGYTVDLNRRLLEHNSKDNKGWTKQSAPWKLDAYLTVENEQTAKIVEAYFKSSAGKEKFQNFSNSNPLHPHPVQGFFDFLVEGREFGSKAKRFKVKKVEGKIMMVMKVNY